MTWVASDLTGKTFGRLKAARRVESRRGKPYWECQCTCGKTTVVRGTALAGGKSQSCGCLAKDVQAKRLTKHGSCGSHEYKAWTNMKVRCTYPQTNGYSRYGGRGIKVCEQWANSFEAFLAYMGHAPSPQHTIDRFPDCNGNYEPGNCRWATLHEQSANRRNTIRLSYHGKQVTLVEMCRERGLNYHTISARVYRGWTAEDAIDTPVGSVTRWTSKYQHSARRR